MGRGKKPDTWIGWRKAKKLIDHTEYSELLNNPRKTKEKLHDTLGIRGENKVATTKRGGR